MKKLVRLSIFALSILSLNACSKDNSYYLFANEETAPRLESAIYPIATKPAEMVIGNELSIASPGETVTIFAPYRVVSDDIQSAVITIKDEISGAVLREIEMTSSTDLSVLNVAVPEEIQGSTFLFANIPVGNDMIGLSLSVSTTIKGNKLSTEHSINHAFMVQ